MANRDSAPSSPIERAQAQAAHLRWSAGVSEAKADEMEAAGLEVLEFTAGGATRGVLQTPAMLRATVRALRARADELERTS